MTWTFQGSLRHWMYAGTLVIAVGGFECSYYVCYVLLACPSVPNVNDPRMLSAAWGSSVYEAHQRGVCKLHCRICQHCKRYLGSTQGKSWVGSRYCENRFYGDFARKDLEMQCCGNNYWSRIDEFCGSARITSMSFSIPCSPNGIIYSDCMGKLENWYDPEQWLALLIYLQNCIVMFCIWPMYQWAYRRGPLG